MITATSQVQKHFQRHNIYKRSKQYFDVQKLKSQQHLLQIQRRKPNYSIQTFDTRVDSSFVNSNQAANKKLENDINFYRKRYQDEKSQAITSSDTINKNFIDNQEQNGQSKLNKSRSKIKAPDWAKMPPRKTIQPNKSTYSNEDQFNNFNMSSPRSRAQLNFQLLSPRSRQTLDNPQRMSKQIDTQMIGKTQQKNHFSQSIYKCLFDYSKIGKYKQHSRKDKTLPHFKPIEFQKVDSARKKAQINPFPIQSQFYLSIGRQFPVQMNMRYNKNNEFYFQNKSARQSSSQYSQKKRKQDMITKRLLQIKKRKSVIDDRQELCDLKYFNRDSYRKKK